MPRQPRLRKKSGYWASDAGGATRYFGKVGEVPFEEAQRRFRDYLAGSSRPPSAPPGDPGPTPPSSPPEPQAATSPPVADLVPKFLAWMERNRDPRNRLERERHLRRWCDSFGDLAVTAVEGTHLESFIDDLAADGHDADYVKKHVTTIKMLFNVSAKRGWIPQGTRPFTGVEPVKVPPKPLAEADLLTDEEVGLLFRHAEADLSPICVRRRFRQRRPDEFRTGEANPWRGFEVMLRCYYHTGARTAELCSVRVGDFQRHTRQLLLGLHKRTRTMKVATARQIALNDAAHDIVDRLCRGRDRDAPIFVQPVHGRQRQPDRPWDRISIARRFRSVRRLAGVREHRSIYDFRHLWISEALMAGIDVLLVARMAGTSLAQVERTYGHFRNQSFVDAQIRLDRMRAGRGSSG
jgi:integrase